MAPYDFDVTVGNHLASGRTELKQIADGQPDIVFHGIRYQRILTGQVRMLCARLLPPQVRWMRSTAECSVRPCRPCLAWALATAVTAPHCVWPKTTRTGVRTWASPYSIAPASSVLTNIAGHPNHEQVHDSGVEKYIPRVRANPNRSTPWRKHGRPGRSYQPIASVPHRYADAAIFPAAKAFVAILQHPQRPFGAGFAALSGHKGKGNGDGDDHTKWTVETLNTFISFSVASRVGTFSISYLKQAIRTSATGRGYSVCSGGLTGNSRTRVRLGHGVF